jgi:hypothetical protein
MTTITLPKTPLVLLFMDNDCRQELDAMFRARDIEVARVVLEGAAKCAEKQDYRHTSARPEIAADIRNLEVKHHE